MATMNKTVRRSPIALAVLALLYESPMHPYHMQHLIKERGKDAVINVRLRASLYQTIERLVRAQLIAVRETTRKEKRPERTIYELTAVGRETMLTWMREMLSTPAREFPEFPAALAYLPLLTPTDAREQLERRVAALTAELDRIDGERQAAAEVIPRLFLVELEYLAAMNHTELAWVQAILRDLDSGQLTWSDEWLHAVAAQVEQGEPWRQERQDSNEQ